MAAGCSAQQPDVMTRVVEVPSPAPYRFITWSPSDSPQTKHEVRAHNRAHQAVINAQKARAK